MQLRKLYDDELDYYGAHPDDAKKLLSLGESMRTFGFEQAKLAAMTTVCQTILNLDATIWKR